MEQVVRARARAVFTGAVLAGAVAAVVFLVGYGLGIAGPSSVSLRRVALRLGSLGVFAALAVAARRDWRNLLSGAVFLAISISSDSQIVVALSLAALVEIIGRKISPRSLEGAAAGLAAMVIVASLPGLAPGMWSPIESAWEAFCKVAVPAYRGEPLIPGPGAGGCLAWMSAATFMAIVAIVRGRAIAWIWIGASFACLVLFLRFAYVPSERPRGMDWTFRPAVWSMVFGSVAAGAVALARSPGRHGLPLVDLTRFPRILAAAVIAFLVAAAWWGVSVPGRRDSLTVTFYNRGGLDWDVPTYGRFGAFSQGMFGLMPRKLERYGYVVRDVKPEDDLTAALETTDVLVLINCDEVWSVARRKSIDRFIRRGGGLLCIGDHTDVFGVMKGFNSLLPDYGIRFRFDSAYSLANKSHGGLLSAAPGPLRWRREGASAPVIGVGASLALEPPARPLAWADYGFSDAGERRNVQGSYLGNYHFDPGESLSRPVVVASALAGQGKVLVFGDTGAFQNAAIDGAFHSNVIPSIDWLGAPIRFYDSGWVRCASWWGGLFLCVGVLSWWARSLPVFGIFLLANVLVLDAAAPHPVPSSATIGRDTAILPYGHAQRTGHYGADGNSVGPLFKCIRRSGFWIERPECIEPGGPWMRAALVVLVAPQEPMEDELVESMLAYMQRGGHVWIATSAKDGAGVRLLLEHLGLALDRGILGRAGSRDDDRLSFVDPSVIHLTDREGVTVVAEAYGKPVVVCKRVGAGCLTLVADTRFFAHSNVEGSWQSDLANLALIRSLLDRCGGDERRISRPFDNPEKPR